MPKSNLMLEEKKGTPSKNTSTSVASASTGAVKGATQVSAKAQAVADKYGTQDSRYDMGNPEFAKTVNSYRDQQKQKTIDNLINYRAKVLNSKADVDGDRFEYAGELNKQIAHLQSGDATYSDFNKARDFLADKFDNRKYDRDYTKATSLLNKSDEEIDSYIADMEARESDLSYGHYTDSLGEEGTIDEIKQVQKNIASARNIKEARKMFDAWKVNENYTPFDVLTMNKDGKTVSYDWTDYDTQSKEIDDRIAELTKQMNESDDMIEKAKIMDDIVALQDESIIVADKKNYQDKLISQMLLDSYADTDDVNTFEEVTSLLASRDDNTIQRMGKAGYSALVGAVNTSMNVFDVCKDYLSHKLGSDALNFHPEQFDVNDGENFSTQLRNYEKRLSNESLYGASSTQEAIVKVTNSTVNQLARMPLGEFGSLFTMALQTGAEAYRENLEMGYDRNTALTSAVVNGIITYNVEQIGWQGLEKALNSGAMNYSVGQYLYSLLTNPISEGLEEGVEYIADTWADKLVHPDWIDENGQINGERMAQSLVETLNTSLDGEQIWDAMFLGYLGGFALDTIVATPGFIQSRKQFNAYTQVKANIQQMIQSGMLTQDEVEYYTNTLTAYDIALNAYKGRSLTSDSIQLFSDMVAPMTSVEDAKMSLQESMKPSAKMDAMLEVDTVNKMREAVGVMQQAQQNLLDHGVKMTVTEFAKLSPEERIRVMEEGEHIQATGSSYKFLKTLLDYKGANGEFNKKTGELYLNPTSDETVYVTMIHELTHSLEGSKVYSSIRNMLIDEVGGQEAWDNMVESKRAEYYKKLFDRRSRMGDAYKDFETGDEAQNQKAYELAQFELVAEQMSKGRSAEAIIDKMAKYNKSAFYRMYDNIRSRFTNNANTKLETMFVNAIRENNLNRQSSSQYSLMEDLPELHKDRAIEEFGITNDFAKAGYIMNDGRLLDFSGGQPTRMEDHRSISSVFDEELDTGTAYLTAFLNEGNIRILPETGGIDVSEVNEPTDFQYSKIRQFMNEDRDGWHTLDISGADGSTIASMEYPPRTSSQKVINDLKAFYKDRTIPQNNTINTGLFQYNSNEGTPQFSLASTFQAVGMEITKVGESIVAFNNGEEVKEVTMGMVFRSPMGNMLRMSMDKGFISRADVIKQVKMYTSMLNTVLRTQNPDLIWAIAGSIGYQPAPENVKFNESAPTMHSAFTSNSDTQYGTTFDVTTICTKTQQLIDVASRVMVELDRGLTEEEIINIVYDEVNKTKDDTGANQPVPCPVCYVFSRWVGSGKLLDSIAKLQDKYVNASTEELEARYKALSKQIDDMAKERGVKGTKARNIVAEQIKEEYDRLSLLKAQKSMLRQSLTEEQENRLASLERDMGILDDWAYLERVRLPSKYNKYHKYDPQKDYVPHDILFDLNKGEQFANEYPYTWAYRTTRGPSMGKAITPYTSQVLGQTIYGVAGSPNGLGKRRSEKYANGKLANAFLSAEITAQAKRKQSDAIRKAKAQNLLGGSRAQSTSDFRFEYVFDYILHFMDLQAIGSKGQTYTKVPEAVPMLASVGYEVNCSLMPFGRGVREVTEDTPNAVQLNDGRWVVLNCSTVTGMNIDDALKFSSIYDNVQPIMVGLNDDHIFACMRDDRITFIIPYHASGGTQARYETMMSELGEIIKAEDRQNYEKSQTDTPLSNATEEQVRRRELRKMILTGKIKEASESDMELIRNSKYLSDLYDRFYVKGVDADCYGVKLSSSQASQIFPFEYWDKTTTFKTADENGRRFWEYCNELGMKPRFAQFGGKDGGEHGYWKMLIDRRMYNNDGTYHVQQAINMSNFNTDFLYRGKMEEGLVQPSKQYKKTAVINGERVELAKYIGDKVIDRINQGQYSLKSTFNSDGEDLTTSQVDSEYDEAVKNNDMETAQRLVREQAEAYAKETGFNLYEGFHGTNAIFNEFRKDLLGSKNFFAESAKLGFFMAGSENTAKSYTGLNSADVFGLNMDPNVQNKAKEFSQQYNVSELDEREAEVRQRITNDVMENDDGWAPHKQYLDEIKENIERAIAENPGDEFLSNVEEKLYNKFWKDEVNEWFVKEGGHEKVESAIANSKEYQDLQEERNRVNQNWSDWLNDYGIRAFGYTPNIKHLFAFMKNPLVHDFKNEGRDIDFSELMRQAHKEGNDGVVFENVADGGDFDTIYAVFEPNQFKSADPVTYDDNGKVIPLSERFNPNKNDIRYSLQDNDDFSTGNWDADDFMNSVDDNMTEDEFADLLLDTMTEDEFADLLHGKYDNDTEEAESVPTGFADGLWVKNEPKGEMLKIDEGYISNGKTVAWKDERIKEMVEKAESGDFNFSGYRYVYALNLSPHEYLALSYMFEPRHMEVWRDDIESNPEFYNNGEVDESRLGYGSYGRPANYMYFTAESDGTIVKIDGQEGNHRAIILKDSGYTKMPILLMTNRPIRGTAVLKGMDAFLNRVPQVNPNFKIINNNDYVPINQENYDRLVKQFGSGTNADIRYSLNDKTEAEKPKKEKKQKKDYKVGEKVISFNSPESEQYWRVTNGEWADFYKRIRELWSQNVNTEGRMPQAEIDEIKNRLLEVVPKERLEKGIENAKGEKGYLSYEDMLGVIYEQVKAQEDKDRPSFADIKVYGRGHKSVYTTYPELRKFYKEAVRKISAEFNQVERGEFYNVSESVPRDVYYTITHNELMDEGWRWVERHAPTTRIENLINWYGYDTVENAIEKIKTGKGDLNTKSVKRILSYLHDDLVHGDTGDYGNEPRLGGVKFYEDSGVLDYTPPNMEYIQALENIAMQEGLERQTAEENEMIPEEVQNQLDADALAEVDYMNAESKNPAYRMPSYTKAQQEAFRKFNNYDSSLVSTGEKATLDLMEKDIEEMVKRERIKDIKKNGFVESDAQAWEQHNKEVDEEIKNITRHTTSVEDADDNLKGIARILDEKPELKSPTAKEVWKKYRDWFVKEFVDHGRAVYRLAKEVKDPLLYALYDYSQNVDNIVGRMFANKRVDLHTGEVIGKGFEEIFAPIRDSGLSREFQNYMYHKLNIDRMTLSDRFSTEFTDEDGKISFLTLPNKPVFNEVVTAKMSQEFCDRMEAEHPEFLEWAKEVYEYEDAELRMLVKSGRLSQEQMNMLKQRYPHYVPISREMDMKPFVTDEQVVSSNRAIKKATGGTANINPLEYAMQKHSRDVYSTILHNDLYGRIAQYYEAPVDAEFEQDTDYKIDTMGNEVQPAQGENPPTLIYYENGERYVIEIDQDLYEALLPRKFAPDLPFVSGVSNLRRNLITGWNPVFMFTNGMKDFQDAQFNTKFNPIEFNSAYAQAWKEIVTNGKLYQMYLNLGGEYNSYFRNDNGKVEGKGVPILSKVIALNEKVEIAPRLAEFICSLKHDMSTAEAMYNASDITTNFKRGGRTAKWMNRNGFTFLNASIQGFDKQVRNITDAKDKEGWKGVAKYMAKLSIVNAIPLVILNGLVWDDDDEYAELSDYIKQNYYIIGKYGEGKFIRIPKGRIASFYQTVMENAVNNDERKSMWDNLMNDLADDMESFMNNVAPNNPIDNNLLSPLVQAHTNTAWYGDDIVPTRLQDERPSEQYDDSTDALSRAIGQFSRKVAEETGSSLFELSPYKINYLLDQYTGMLGDIGLPMLTPRAENRIDNQVLSGFANPLLDKFTTDSTLKNQRVTDFYAMKEELNKLASSSEATEEQILASKFMNSVSGEMSQLYKDKRAIQSDTSMPNSEKFDEARNIQEQIIELAKKGLTGYDQIDIRGENATVGDVEYKKSSGGDWAKTKTRDFSGYYSTYGLDEDKQSQFKSAMEMTSRKDENGKTIRNSEALATRKALEDMGEYENVLKYIEENGLEYKDFDLNKTVVGYDESKFNDKYNAVYETQEASNEPKSTSYAPRRNASQNGSNDSEDDFFSTLLNIINAPVSTSKSGLSANVAQVFREGRQRSKSIRSNRDDLRKAIAKAKRKYNL